MVAPVSYTHLDVYKRQVYVHIEAPDECGHRAELDNKVRAIELIDQKVIGPIIKAMEGFDAFKVMVLPDHATPISLKTHTSDPVPFLMYSTANTKDTPLDCFDEANACLLYTSRCV